MKLENSEARIIPTIKPSTQMVIETPHAALELTFSPAFFNPVALNHSP